MTITDEQRERRRDYLGASDAAAALGLDPYRTKRDLWLIKTGKVEPEDIGDNDAVWMGNSVEGPLLGWWSEQAKPDAWSSVEPEYQSTMGDGVVPLPLLVHPDAVAKFDGSKPQPVEAKYRGRADMQQWGPNGSDGVPIGEIVQVYTQAIAMEADTGHLVALLHDGWTVHRRWYRIPIREDLAIKIINGLARFWMHVVDGTEPDGDVSLDLAMSRKRDECTAVRIPQEVADRYSWARKASSVENKRETEYKAAVIEAMGEHAIGLWEDAGGTLWSYGPDQKGVWRLKKAVAAGLSDDTIRAAGFEPPMEGIR